MSTRLSLDRFEGKGKQIAVLLTDDGETLNLPRSVLPPGVKPGDVLTLTLEHDPVAIQAGRGRDPRRSRQAGGTRPGGRHQAVKALRMQRLVALLFTGLAFMAAPPSTEAQLFGRPAASPATIEILDVGQGDSILIRSPEGKTALIDAGPTRNAALSVLRRKGIKSLDLVAISHHHSDHYGGMDEVVRAMKPRYFLASRSGHTTTLYLKLLKTVEAEKVTVIEPTSRPRKIELGSIELTIFPQPPEDRKEENNNSIGLRVKYGSFSVLLTGDSEETERQWWLKHDPELVRNCTILKLAHHGSRNGTDARWLPDGPARAGRGQPGQEQ